MKEIKSRKAEEYIDKHTMGGFPEGDFYSSDANDAVAIAEQDARERAAIAHCKQCQHNNEGCPSEEEFCYDIYKCKEVEQFLKLYDDDRS